MEKSYATDKGLLIFYDWEECFDSLPDKECKELLLAMIRFKKYGTPQPEFTGVTKIIASLLFPQIERQIQEFLNGKKGGRPKKSKDVNDGDSTYINNEEKSHLRQEGEELLTAALSKKQARDNSRHKRDWAVKPDW